MVKTPISVPNKRERGLALLEAAIALGIVAMIAAAGLSAFSRAASVNRTAEIRLHALADAENALEQASVSSFLAEVLDTGTATLSGSDWQVTGSPYQTETGEGPLALIELIASAGAERGAEVTLRTLRAIPR
jgi:Tfp pilus assembly protein PilV